MAREDIPLEYVGENMMEGRKKEKKEEKREEEKRVRSSNFSLDFSEIWSSAFVRARGKVHPLGESFE